MYAIRQCGRISFQDIHGMPLPAEGKAEHGQHVLLA
jgi:hypothetical protein